jgi:hypothetical protein
MGSRTAVGFPSGLFSNVDAGHGGEGDPHTILEALSSYRRTYGQTSAVRISFRVMMSLRMRSASTQSAASDVFVGNGGRCGRKF